MGDMLFKQLRRILATEGKHVRCDGPVHHSLGQPGNGIKRHLSPSLPAGHGVAAVSHTAGQRLHHAEHSHTHGRSLIRDAALETVAHGRNRVLAGHDLLPDFAGFFGQDIQFRPVLTRKGHAQSIFAHGAAAQGKAQLAAATFHHARHGLFDGLLQLRRQGRVEDALLQCGRQAEQIVHAVHVRALDAAGDLVTQPVVFHEGMIGVDRHGKTVRHGQPHIGRDFAKIGHLAADLRHVPQTNVRQGQQQGAVRDQALPLQHVGDAAADIIESGLQTFVLVVGKRVELAYHLVHGRCRPRTGTANIAHAEGSRTGQGLFHFAHDLERVLVGGQQATEPGTTFAELLFELFLACQILGAQLFLPAQQVSQSCEYGHITQRREPPPPS